MRSISLAGHGQAGAGERDQSLDASPTWRITFALPCRSSIRLVPPFRFMGRVFNELAHKFLTFVNIMRPVRPRESSNLHLQLEVPVRSQLFKELQKREF